MKSQLSIFLLVLLVASCGKDIQNQMIVLGNVDGLKKGTLYLQKVQDSILVDIDSLEIRGDNNFSFEHEITEGPELFYLYLKKADNNDLNDRISFFGEADTIMIKTTWNRFDSDVKISGSQVHEQFAQSREMLSKFNTAALSFLQQQMNPEVQADTVVLDSISRLADKNLKRRYLYVLNFALNNPDSYISPYLALTEAPDANPKYLDSINKSLTPEVAKSKYGIALDQYVKGLKE